MSASRPPSDDVPRSNDRTGHGSFAWGKTPGSERTVVGRDRELAELAATLQSCRGGVTAALVITGEPGIGKTTVLDAAARLATGFRCLWVRGFESESVLPYAGLLQLIGPLRERLSDLPAGQAAALAQAVGWEPADGGSERFLVGAALLSLLAAESARLPVLLLVDDLQWVDRESADALRFATRRLSDVPVCSIWAVRTGGVDAARLGAGLPVWPLAGLSGSAARALLSERMTEPVVDRLVDETGGSPLALLEVAGALSAAQRVGAAPLPDPLPVGDRLVEVHQRQLFQLSEPARRAALLTALNLSGTGATVVAALRQQGLDAVSALDEALDNGVLVRVGPEPRLRHPLLRTAAVQAATAAELRSAHRALADAQRSDPPSLAETWHRAEAAVGADQGLALDLVRAADGSRTRQGHAAASAAMERAALLSPDPGSRADWTAAAAADAFLAGDTVRTRSLVARVLDGSSPRSAEGRALLTLGMLEEYAGSVPDAVGLLAAAAERLTGPERVRALAELALARFRLNDLAGVAAGAIAMAEAADRRDPEQRMLVDFTAGVAAILAGDPSQGGALLAGTLTLLSRPPLREDPRSLVFLALAAGFLGNPGEAMAVGSEQLKLAQRRGALGALVPALALSAAGRAWIGDHAQAFADAAEAAELGDQLGYAADVAVAVEMLAWQSAARGLHDEALAALERARSLTDRAGTTAFAAHQAMTVAFCAQCRNDPATVIAVLEARLAADGGVGSMGEPLGVAPDLIEAYLAVGRRADAVALTARFAEVTPAGASPSSRSLLGRCRGLTVSDPVAADGAFEAALAAHLESLDPFETARTRLLYGERLRRAGQRVRAREQLQAALDEFTQMDLTAWVHRADRELAATGAHPRSRSPQVREPLTSQETRVALAAAEGLSTKEIAAALFLSPKTVEHHLSSIYRKRGYRSRAELAAWFRRLGADS